MKYQPIPRFTKSEIEKAIAEDDIKKLIYISLFASLYYEDRAFAEQVCIKPASHSDSNVRAMAIEGFEHLARIDGRLNKDIIKPIIERASKHEDDFVRQKAEDAKDGIKHFLEWEFNK